MGVYTNDEGREQRRMITIGAVLVFQALLFWGFKSGFAMKVMEVLQPPQLVDIIQEQVDEAEPPPPPPPKMELPPVEVPPPVIDINIPMDAAPTTAISNVTDRPPPPPPVVAAAPPPPPPTKLELNKRATQPNTADYYPPTSARLGEEGVTRVRVCVGTNGRVKDSTVAETSSHERLDEAALKVAKLYRFIPPTSNGQPTEGCAVMPVRFTLKEDR